MIKGHSLWKLQACCSHVIFHVRPVWKGSDLWLILQPWLVVKAVQPEETRQAAALVNSCIRDRRVLVNWWQMLVSLDANGGFREEERSVCIKLCKWGIKIAFHYWNSDAFLCTCTYLNISPARVRVLKCKFVLYPWTNEKLASREGKWQIFNSAVHLIIHINTYRCSRHTDRWNKVFCWLVYLVFQILEYWIIFRFRNLNKDMKPK